MIEVEKKFQPTNEQLQALIKSAQFLGEGTNHDIRYDYADYQLLKKDIRLRKRNDTFELKIGQSAGVSEEMEAKEDIENYFNTKNLEEFINNNLIIIADYSAKRQKYKKEDFIIDIDKMSFGYNLCEIEILVEKEEDVKKAQDKIINLAKEFNFELKEVVPKLREYFRLMKPDVYKKLYGEK